MFPNINFTFILQQNPKRVLLPIQPSMYLHNIKNEIKIEKNTFSIEILWENK